MTLPKGSLADDPKLPPISVAGRPLYSIKFSPEIFLNKTTTIWGSTNTGKTIIADNILYTLRNSIPVVVGYLGSTNEKNGMGKHFPKGSYTKSMTFESFNNLAFRMRSMADIYSKVNDINILLNMAYKYVPDITFRQDIADIKYKMNKCIDEIKANNIGTNGGEGKIQKIKERSTDEIKMVVRKAISKHKPHLVKYKLSEMSEDERLVVHFINYCPYVLCFIDDMTTKIITISKQKKQGEAFQDIFTQARWWYLTMLMILHAPNSIPPEIKKGIFINIFTESTQVNHFFTTKGVPYSKDLIKEALALSNELYNNWKSHYRCLVYIREDPCPFRYYVADESISVKSFTMGSESFKKLCEELYKKEVAVGLSDNPFLNSIKKAIKTETRRPHSIAPVKL